MSARAGNGAAASPAVASKGKKRAAKVMLASPKARPVVVKPERLALRLDERRAHAPHTLARKAGKSCAMDICEAAPAAEPAGGWETKVLMQAEAKEEDLGLKPGPKLATVKVPTFSGKPCGINKELFPKLTADSSAFDFMETQITRENKIEIMNLTANAMDNYFLLQKTRGVKVTGKYKLSLEPDFLRDNPDAFDCWLAARFLVGQNAMSVPQKELWRPKGSHCHARLVGCLRHAQYCCLNKFLTLSDEDGKLLTEEDAKAIVAAEKEKAAAVPGAGGGAGGSSAGTPASHAAGGGGGGCPTNDDDDDDDDKGEGEDEVQALELGSVTERHGQLIYVAPEDETIKGIALREGWKAGEIVKDNKGGLPALNQTVKLRAGTELCVGLGVGIDLIEDSSSSGSDSDSDSDGDGGGGGKAPRRDRIRKRRYAYMELKLSTSNGRGCTYIILHVLCPYHHIRSQVSC
jgi:hypothetical protein